LQQKVDPLLLLVVVVVIGMAVTVFLPLSSSPSVADDIAPLQAGVILD